MIYLWNYEEWIYCDITIWIELWKKKSLYELIEFRLGTGWPNPKPIKLEMGRPVFFIYFGSENYGLGFHVQLGQAHLLYVFKGHYSWIKLHRLIFHKKNLKTKFTTYQVQLQVVKICFTLLTLLFSIRYCLGVQVVPARLRLTDCDLCCE